MSIGSGPGNRFRNKYSASKTTKGSAAAAAASDDSAEFFTSNVSEKNTTVIDDLLKGLEQKKDSAANYFSYSDTNNKEIKTAIKKILLASQETNQFRLATESIIELVGDPELAQKYINNAQVELDEVYVKQLSWTEGSDTFKNFSEIINDRDSSLSEVGKTVSQQMAEALNIRDVDVEILVSNEDSDPIDPSRTPTPAEPRVISAADKALARDLEEQFSILIRKHRSLLQRLNEAQKSILKDIYKTTNASSKKMSNWFNDQDEDVLSPTEMEVQVKLYAKKIAEIEAELAAAAVKPKTVHDMLKEFTEKLETDIANFGPLSESQTEIITAFKAKISDFESILREEDTTLTDEQRMEQEFDYLQLEDEFEAIAEFIAASNHLDLSNNPSSTKIPTLSELETAVDEASDRPAQKDVLRTQVIAYDRNGDQIDYTTLKQSLLALNMTQSGELLEVSRKIDNLTDNLSRVGNDQITGKDAHPDEVKKALDQIDDFSKKATLVIYQAKIDNLKNLDLETMRSHLDETKPLIDLSYRLHYLKEEVEKLTTPELQALAKDIGQFQESLLEKTPQRGTNSVGRMSQETLKPIFIEAKVMLRRFENQFKAMQDVTT